MAYLVEPTEIAWHGLRAVYTQEERQEMAGLPVSEALVLHCLKHEFNGQIGESRPAPATRPSRSEPRNAAITIALVATQRASDALIEQVEDFIETLTNGAYTRPVTSGQDQPRYHFVVGDTSIMERRAAQFCQDRKIGVTIVAKADKGSWDEGSEIRDERVVALSDMVYAFDSSSRTKSYQALCKRQRKPFHRL